MEPYRFMMIGAHPDDMELRCGGLALRLRRQGHKVMFVSMTDGSAGHQSMQREALAKRREAETQAVAKRFDIEYRVMPVPDGELEPTLAVRKMLMREIRAFAPHVIITHRTVDYHPDHRACGQLVMDCAYLVNVPLFCPESPCPPHTPAVLSAWDHFTRPVPFSPDVIVPIDGQLESKIDGCLCHVSQFYEWLPYIEEWEAVNRATVFEEKTARLREVLRTRFARETDSYRDKLPEGVRFAEAFEWNEYGAPLSEELRRVMTEMPCAVLK
ncbi:MAG: PIG-L family deacetylase [Clostridia bacterium]|nr:PIG-L family deacetylase [Clostridia bacterium]